MWKRKGQEESVGWNVHSNQEEPKSWEDEKMVKIKIGYDFNLNPVFFIYKKGQKLHPNWLKG